jgi:hypothetical protein
MDSKPHYNWTDEYREIIELYWWQPQSMGRSRTNPSRFPTADAMWESVSRLETTLNHVLNIFFALYPVEKLHLTDSAGRLEMIGSRRLEEIQRAMKNETQPDFFFEAEAFNFAIELKTKSKSNLEQIRKYIAFQQHIAADKPLHLLYLTPHTEITEIFEEKFPDVAAIDSALDAATSGNLDLSFMSFREFVDRLKAAVPAANDIEAKLLDGVITYFNEYFGV